MDPVAGRWEIMEHTTGYQLLKGLYDVHYIITQAGTLMDREETAGYEGAIYKTIDEQKVELCPRKVVAEELSLLSVPIRLLSLVNCWYSAEGVETPDHLFSKPTRRGMQVLSFSLFEIWFKASSRVLHR